MTIRKLLLAITLWGFIMTFSKSYSQKQIIEVFTNYVIDLPYSVYLNDQESQLVDILKQKNNFELGLGYRHKIIRGLYGGTEISYGNKDLNFINNDFFSAFGFGNIYMKEHNFRASLKIAYQLYRFKASFGYGWSHNNVDFTSGQFRSKYHYLKEPTDLSQVNLNATHNQFYTLHLQYLPRLSESIDLACGIKYIHNFNHAIIKDVFEVRHSFLLLSLGLNIKLQNLQK